MKIYIGCDHAAFLEKEKLKDWLMKDYEVEDMGPFSEERCDYPDYAAKVAKNVQDGLGLGLLICGSGIGVSMVANRFAKVRAALCRNKDEAFLSRQHNDANILCMGARLSTVEEMMEICSTWLKADFEGGRHVGRIEKFNDWGKRD